MALISTFTHSPSFHIPSLCQAVVLKRRSRKLQCCIFVCVGSIVLAILIVVVILIAVLVTQLSD